MRTYLGLALIPQAGVAIGLAFLGQRLLPRETGNLMLAIILSSSVLYEMIGPVCAKLALVLSGSIPSEHFLPPETDRSDSLETPEQESLAEEEEQLKVQQDFDRSIGELMEEMNAGVDERDDDDMEKNVVVRQEKEKGKNKKRKVKR